MVGVGIMGKYEKLGKNVMFITLGNFASKILTFLMIPFYTNVLSTNEFGVSDLITSTVNLILPFFTLLISEAVMRFTLEEKYDNSQVFSIGIYTILIGTFIMVAFSPIIIINKVMAQYYWYFVFYYFVSAIQIMLSQYVKGINRVMIYSFAGVIQTVSMIILSIVFLAIYKTGITGYLLSLIVSNIITIFILWIGANISKSVLAFKKLNRKLVYEMYSYSIPMIPNSLNWWISNSADKYMLMYFSGMGVTGIYSVSQKIPSMLSVISTIFMSAWQISAVDNFGSKDSLDFYSDIYRKYSSLNIISITTLICFTKLLANFLFSKDFYEGWIFVPILLLAYYFNAMSSFLGTIYTSAKKTKMLFISTVVAASSNISLNFVFIPLFGGMGASISTFISYFITWIIRIINTRRIMIINWNRKNDICSICLIIIQIIIVMYNNSFWCSILVFFIVLIINRKVFIYIFQFVEKILNRRLF
ncbi:lipopolysaccharide biosynthesis protein [Sporofaciens musculi]|jgi:Membrane protein involved in the export of O-antigen and teichoic acid|nr:oligosaccharide flippase family protein [Sporofaciens musculi]